MRDRLDRVERKAECRHDDVLRPNRSFAVDVRGSDSAAPSARTTCSRGRSQPRAVGRQGSEFGLTTRANPSPRNAGRRGASVPPVNLSSEPREPAKPHCQACAAVIAATGPVRAASGARVVFIRVIRRRASFLRRLSVRAGHRLQVLVRDNNVDQALKALKKKMQGEGVVREVKLRDHCEKRAREKAEAVRHARKLARKTLQREGLVPMKPKPAPGAR